MQNITHTKQFLLPLLTCLFIYNAIDVTRAIGFEMTNQWHIPQKTDVKFDNKKRPLKLHIETKIVLYKPQQTETLAETQQRALKTKQMHLIQARILSRKKLYPQGKKIYEKLVKQYPSSLDIHADYAEILLAYGEYEMAMKEIQYLLNQNPNHLRGLRLQAAFYDHLNLPSWSFTTYQRLLDQYPNDSGILFDYASQRSNAGHWYKALNAYSHVLETDPDNIYALRATHNILKERRPAINAQFVLHEGSDGTNRIHQQYSWRKTLTKRLTFRGIIDDISLQTPDTLAIDSNSIQQHTIEFQMEMYPHLQVTGGLFHYAGPGSKLSFYGKLIYHWMPDLESQIVVLRQTPWFDPVQATTDDGSYDECQIAVAKTILSTYRLNTIVVYRRYALNRMGHYGKRLGWHMDISRQVLIQPNTTFQLAMDQASFSYNTENRSVPMVPEETTYSIGTTIQGQPLSYLTYVLSSGYRWDPRRSLAGFFLNPGIGWHLSKQIALNTSYAYSSESTGVSQGSTQTFQFNIVVIF